MRSTPGGGCWSIVSFHNPSDGPEPVETPGLTGSSTGAAGLFKTAAGLVTLDGFGVTLSVFVPDKELFVV